MHTADKRVCKSIVCVLPLPPPFIYTHCRAYAGHATEAEQVYRDDMVPGRHPENPWSLFGLKTALRAQDTSREVDVEVAAINARLQIQLDKVETTSYDGTTDKGFTLTASCACAGRPIVGDAVTASL